MSKPLMLRKVQAAGGGLHGAGSGAPTGGGAAAGVTG
jgi:hypothetical protein